jgi:hypothetical protein
MKLQSTATFRLGVGKHLSRKLPNKKLKYYRVCDIRKGPEKKRGGQSTVECYGCKVGLCPGSCRLLLAHLENLTNSEDGNLNEL